ncbi:MAG: hypothetical protein HRU12_01915 [Phaeodactylibacter sp.]|nr:hypothetical protein [Phaeodactylibacter sp.]
MANTSIKISKSRGGSSWYSCICGKLSIVANDYRVLTKHTTSCGKCYHINGVARYKHKLGRVYDSMLTRCSDKSKGRNRKNYYEKGIRVSKEFLEEYSGFENYVNHMEGLPNAYKEGYTVDRIDGNKGYQRGNLRWETYQVQNENRSCTLWYSYKGKKMTLKEVSDIEGIKYHTLYKRVVTKGMGISAAVGSYKDK